MAMLMLNILTVNYHLNFKIHFYLFLGFFFLLEGALALAHKFGYFRCHPAAH